MYKKKKAMLVFMVIFILITLNFNVTPANATKIPQSNNPNTGATTTILVYDTSGSMGEADISGSTKMRAAINAGLSILSVIDAEDQANLGAQNEIGVVEFSRDAWTVADLTIDIGVIQSALGSLSAGGGTALPSGLNTALEMANTATVGSSPVIILLSDGIPTTGLNGEGDETIARQQALDLASNAGLQGICVYTIGFGVPDEIGSYSGDASIDEAFLQEIASRSGCGKYYNAQNATDLRNVFVLTRHESLGEIRYQGQGEIAQDEQIIISTVDVPAGQESLLYTIQWPGSQLDPTLFDPSGKQVDTSYPGATFTRGATLATIIVQNPIAGQWQLGAIGRNVPEGILTYNAALSTRTKTIAPAIQPLSGRSYRDTNSSNAGILPFMVFIVLFGAVLIFYIKNKKLKSSAYLQVVNDPANTRVIPLKDNFIIGRGSASGLRLADTTASRQHTRINYINGTWVIQDLGSARGTFVNGQRIQTVHLKNGDQIKIGQATFVFRV